MSMTQTARSCTAIAALTFLGLTSVARADGPTVMAEGKEMPSGGTYLIPGHSEGNSLALFTETVQVISFYNKTGADMTIDKVELVAVDDLIDEEFLLLENQIKRQPLKARVETVKKGGNWGFKVRFYPVKGGKRIAKLKVTYDGSKTYELQLEGRARGDLRFFSGGMTKMHKLFGATKTDEILSGAVGGPEGSIYFTGQATQIADRFSTDIFWGKVNADGSLAWAKLWNGAYMDKSPDSGQNAETGGTCNSLTVDDDGNLYLCGITSPGSSNNLFAALVIKIDGKTGEPIWEQVWRPEWPKSLVAKHEAQAYALCVRKGMVYVTGHCGSGEAMLLVLDAAKGELQSQFSFDPSPGYNDRGYAIVAHDGAVTIAGLADSRAFVMRIALAGRAGNDAKVTWSRTVDMGRGSNINAIDTDAEGNIYASCDRRGATTFFSAIRINNDGKLAWGKTYKGTAGDRNNTHLVKVIGDQLFVGGRLGAAGIYDTSSGDGLLLGLNCSDGAQRWSAFYYTGTGPDEVCEHRIKGIAVFGKTLTIVGQSYTGSRNGERYFGYWYDGPNELVDDKPDATDFGLAADLLKPVEKGALQSAAALRKLIDIKEKLEWVDAKGRTGVTGDGDIAVWQLELK